MSNDFSIAEGRSPGSGGRSLTLPTQRPTSTTPAHESAQAKTATVVTSADSATQEHQFLRLKLVSDITALLPMQQLSEVLTIPVGQVTPIPNMPAWVMGIYNWRGDILWLADLSHFLGLVSWNEQTSSDINYVVVVLNVNAMDDSSSLENNQLIGLIVNQTEEVERCDPNDIQSSIASSMSPTLARFLRGYWLNPAGEMLAVLDGHAMLEGMAKSN
ncbi:MAG: chemotaxis protein CheW [Leptolyngbyaceae bacterium]|nr:chemotaxis protein CheW [Leptolyngbyaceae bacterium]